MGGLATTVFKESRSFHAPRHLSSGPRHGGRYAARGEISDKSFFEKLTGPTDAPASEILFGNFCLRPKEFLLLEGGTPVQLGSRALEILTILLERRGELVTKHELMERVWPCVFVEPANLTVHMSALRRVLRDGQDGNRFIINIPGRGYSFVASVEATLAGASARATSDE